MIFFTPAENTYFWGRKKSSECQNVCLLDKVTYFSFTCLNYLSRSNDFKNANFCSSFPENQDEMEVFDLRVKTREIPLMFYL